MSYKHLSQTERYQIHVLMKAGHLPVKFTHLLGRHKSSISRELSRNTGKPTIYTIVQKFLGELSYENAITLRTSIVGHELGRAKSLLDWFLGQSVKVKGFTKAVFSGLPTLEIARVVKECILAIRELSGVYHLSVNPINK